jgi:hypothetical protein
MNPQASTYAPTFEQGKNFKFLYDT